MAFCFLGHAHWPNIDRISCLVHTFVFNFGRAPYNDHLKRRIVSEELIYAHSQKHKTRFVAFCYLLDQWRRDPGPPAFLGYAHWPSRVVNNAQAAIAFALFSWLSWMAAAYMHYTGQDNGDVGFRSPGMSLYLPRPILFFSS